MKQIDKNFPVFAQIEDGDHIFLFNAYAHKPLETIKALKVKWYDNNRLICWQNNNSFDRYITKDLLVKSYSYSAFDGVGFATSFEAAKQGITEVLDEKISNVQEKIDEYEKNIRALQIEMDAYCTSKAYVI